MVSIMAMMTKEEGRRLKNWFPESVGVAWKYGLTTGINNALFRLRLGKFKKWR